MRRVVWIAATLLALAGAVAGCRGQTSEDPPVHPLRNMFRQQRYNAQSESNYFQDRRTMRVPVAGTLAREEYEHGFLADERIALGREGGNATYVMTIPAELVQHARFLTPQGETLEGMNAMVHRGRERFNIYCTACHGFAGDGQGIVYLRSLNPGGRPNYSFVPPTNLHEPRVRTMPDGQIYTTITNGVRTMPSYAAQIPVADRWAIVAYLRALQLSQTGAAQ